MLHVPLFDFLYAYIGSVDVVLIHGAVHGTEFDLTLEVVGHCTVLHCAKRERVLRVPQLKHTHQLLLHRYIHTAYPVLILFRELCTGWCELY